MNTRKTHNDALSTRIAHNAIMDAKYDYNMGCTVSTKTLLNNGNSYEYIGMYSATSDYLEGLPIHESYYDMLCDLGSL